MSFISGIINPITGEEMGVTSKPDDAPSHNKANIGTVLVLQSKMLLEQLLMAYIIIWLTRECNGDLHLNEFIRFLPYACASKKWNGTCTIIARLVTYYLTRCIIFVIH